MKLQALLTLRSQCDRCRNIKGEVQIYGSFPNQATPTFPFSVVFMVGLGQPQLRAKFEVASFSRCTNIKGGPKILGNSYSTRLLSMVSW